MSTKKMVAAAAAFAVVASLSIDDVENQQGRQVTVVVTQTPTGLATTGQPIEDARVEYVEDGADDSASIASLTDANGSLKLTVGNPGIVTASKSGLTTISVGWRTDSGSTLRIELPPPASLSGRVYDMANRQAVLEAHVSVVVDHTVNPHSNAGLVENGNFAFNGLPPGAAVLLVQAPGFAPATASTTLVAGDSHSVDVGLLLEGSVSGSVVDGDGDAVAGALVEIVYDGFENADLLSSGLSGYVLTGDDGLFYATGIVPNEQFTIYAELEDGSRSDTHTLSATPGITIENVVLRID